jgi:hypothetical protein
MHIVAFVHTHTYTFMYLHTHSNTCVQYVNQHTSTLTRSPTHWPTHLLAPISAFCSTHCSSHGAASQSILRVDDPKISVNLDQEDYLVSVSVYEELIQLYRPIKRFKRVERAVATLPKAASAAASLWVETRGTVVSVPRHLQTKLGKSERKRLKRERRQLRKQNRGTPSLSVIACVKDCVVSLWVSGASSSPPTTASSSALPCSSPVGELVHCVDLRVANVEFCRQTNLLEGERVLLRQLLIGSLELFSPSYTAPGLGRCKLLTTTNTITTVATGTGSHSSPSATPAIFGKLQSLHYLTSTKTPAKLDVELCSLHCFAHTNPISAILYFFFEPLTPDTSTSTSAFASASATRPRTATASATPSATLSESPILCTAAGVPDRSSSPSSAEAVSAAASHTSTTEDQLLKELRHEEKQQKRRAGAKAKPEIRAVFKSWTLALVDTPVGDCRPVNLLQFSMDEAAFTQQSTGLLEFRFEKLATMSGPISQPLQVCVCVCVCVGGWCIGVVGNIGVCLLVS